ncbi:glycosyltransferase family 2 protein [Dactylosporangium sp. McL0621]|uniref:glycosyltransferase family 2 protein n=1 Tax=Dactylosporangium sp. McL0621 TaxID=3415678 RepID=UPI003CF21997
MSVSVVVPCYRSASILPRLVARLNAVLPAIDPVHEIILVVDSTDVTWDAARDLAAEQPHVQAIRMARNYGQHNALIAGIRAASCERIITMDDDLQHPPEELPKLAAALTDDLDVVYAVSEAEEHGLLRNLTSWGAKSLVMGRSMGIPNADVLGALRIFRTFLGPASTRSAGRTCPWTSCCRGPPPGSAPWWCAWTSAPRAAPASRSGR